MNSSIDDQISQQQGKVKRLREWLEQNRRDWMTELKVFAAKWVLDTAKREYMDAGKRITIDPRSAAAAKREVESLSEEMIPSLVDEYLGSQKFWPHFDPKLPFVVTPSNTRPQDGARHVLWHLYPILGKYGLCTQQVLEYGGRQGNKYPGYLEFPPAMKEKLDLYFRNYEELRSATARLVELNEHKRRTDSEHEWEKF